MIKAMVAVAFSVVLSVIGLAGCVCSVGFKLIDAINDFNKTLKNSQSEDSEEE